MVSRYSLKRRASTDLKEKKTFKTSPWKHARYTIYMLTHIQKLGAGWGLAVGRGRRTFQRTLAVFSAD